MAVLDAKLEFSDAQALASVSSGASVVSTNVTNLGASETDCWGNSITPDIGEGGELEFNVAVDTALVGSSAALDCKLVTKASSASISSGGTTLATLTIPATSAAGTRKSVKVPSGTIYQYTGVLYAASGGALTSAKINSWINLDHEKID